MFFYKRDDVHRNSMNKHILSTKPADYLVVHGLVLKTVSIKFATYYVFN